MNESKPCPVCKQQTLRPHCPEEGSSDTRCGWWSCGNRRCDAVLDFRGKKGHAINPTNFAVRRRVAFLPGGEVA